MGLARMRIVLSMFQRQNSRRTKMSKDDYDLGKLGTVLAIANQTNRDMLEMLKKQQERQIRIIWASLAIVLVAFLIVGVGTWCAFNSFNKLTEQIEGGIHYETAEESSERLSP